MERKALVLRKSRKYKGLVAQGLALGVPGPSFPAACSEVIEMICHPDRSAAEWRDLLFVWVSTHAARCDSVANFKDMTPGRNYHFSLRNPTRS
jgi:hypothetical protein